MPVRLETVALCWPQPWSSEGTCSARSHSLGPPKQKPGSRDQQHPGLSFGAVLAFLLLCKCFKRIVMKSVGTTDTIPPSSPSLLSAEEQPGAGLPLSSQRKHICKENEPPQEIHLAW